MADTFEQMVEKAANSLWASEKYTEAEKEKFPVSWYDAQQRASKLLLDIGLGPDKVIVPREPTEAMIDAGHEAGDFHIMHYDGTDKPGTPRYSLSASYAAMIAAAEGKSNG